MKKRAVLGIFTTVIFLFLGAFSASLFHLAFSGNAVIKVNPIDLYSGKKCSLDSDCPSIDGYFATCKNSGCAYSLSKQPQAYYSAEAQCTSDADCGADCSYVYVENASFYLSNPALDSIWNDSKWDSFIALPGSGGYLEVRYPKSPNSDISKMLWRVKYSNPNKFGALVSIEKNLSIPSECWNINGEYLSFIVNYNIDKKTLNFSCLADSGIKNIYNYSGSSNWINFYEEGAYYCEKSKCDKNTQKCYTPSISKSNLVIQAPTPQIESISEEICDYSGCFTPCYQETANESNALDGNCLLNYSGGYSQSPSNMKWMYESMIYDTDWNTYSQMGSPNGGNYNSFSINYVIPNETSFAVWKIRDGNGTRNLSIPSECLKTNILDLSISTSFNSRFYNVSLRCSGSSGPQILYSYTASSYYSIKFYEEAMIWYTKIKIECIDSDFFYNSGYFTDGNVAINKSGEIIDVSYDSCFTQTTGLRRIFRTLTKQPTLIFDTTGTNLMEARCTGYGFSEFKNISCRIGCADNACLPGCYDYERNSSDAGIIDSYINGTANDGAENYEDTCLKRQTQITLPDGSIDWIETNYVRDYFCSQDCENDENCDSVTNLSYTDINCTNECYNGACYDPCDDNDGFNIFYNGTVRYNPQLMQEDVCVNTAQVKEFFCNENDTAQFEIINCTEGTICENGACRIPPGNEPGFFNFDITAKTSQGIICFEESDCDYLAQPGYTPTQYCYENKPCTDEEVLVCSNPGTAGSSCSRTTERVCGDACSGGQVCENGECVTQTTTSTRTHTTKAAREIQTTLASQQRIVPTGKSILPLVEGQAGQTIQAFEIPINQNFGDEGMTYQITTVQEMLGISQFGDNYFCADFSDVGASVFEIMKYNNWIYNPKGIEITNETIGNRCAFVNYSSSTNNLTGNITNFTYAISNITFYKEVDLCAINSTLCNTTIYGMGISANSDLGGDNPNALIRVILIDEEGKRHILYENSGMKGRTYDNTAMCEETCVLNKVKPKKLIIQMDNPDFDAVYWNKPLSLTINSIYIYLDKELVPDGAKQKGRENYRYDLKFVQEVIKVDDLNENLDRLDLGWKADLPISLFLNERIGSEMVEGTEVDYFNKGVFNYYVPPYQLNSMNQQLKDSGESIKLFSSQSKEEQKYLYFPDKWDWMSFHDANKKGTPYYKLLGNKDSGWMTSVKDQMLCYFPKDWKPKGIYKDYIEIKPDNTYDMKQLGAILLKHATPSGFVPKDNERFVRSIVRSCIILGGEIGLGTCWAFASTGSLEGVANLYYNQPLNLDLSEQALVCDDFREKHGGIKLGSFDIKEYVVIPSPPLWAKVFVKVVPGTFTAGEGMFQALNFIKEEGINKESTFSKYGSTGNKGCLINFNEKQYWRYFENKIINGGVTFERGLLMFWPRSDHVDFLKNDFNIKLFLIENGPIAMGANFDKISSISSSGLGLHAVVYAGYTQVFYLVKNSWSVIRNNFSPDVDTILPKGYDYFRYETLARTGKDIFLVSIVHPYPKFGGKPKIICRDEDKDGYCNWNQIINRENPEENDYLFESASNPSYKNCPEDCWFVPDEKNPNEKKLKPEDCNDGDDKIGPYWVYDKPDKQYEYTLDDETKKKIPSPLYLSLDDKEQYHDCIKPCKEDADCNAICAGVEKFPGSYAPFPKGYFKYDDKCGAEGEFLNEKMKIADSFGVKKCVCCRKSCYDAEHPGTCADDPAKTWRCVGNIADFDCGRGGCGP